jgi:2-keto-4-pentenoate hydratase
VNATEDHATQFAQAILAARQRDVALPMASLPELSSLNEALSVQSLVAEKLGAQVGGWKIWLRADGPVAAPLYHSVIQTGRARHIWSDTRFSAIEVEIAFRLRRDLPPRPEKPYAVEEIRDAVDSVIVAIEIVQSRIVELLQAPFLQFLADNIGNGGFVVGSEISDWRALDLGRLRCVVQRDGAIIHDAVGGHGSGDPITPLVAYANRQIDTLGGLKKGQVVTTGTVCGLLSLTGPCAIEARIEHLGEVQLDVLAAASSVIG